MRKASFITSLLVSMLLVGCSKEKHVAEVDGRTITADNFRIRYASYLSSTQSRDNILLRQKILNNMINEVLIRDDMRRLGLDRDKIAEKKLYEIRMQALLNAYAVRVGHDSLNITDRELYNEFRMSNSRASARYLYARTEEEAWGLKRKLESGATFESLARDIFEDPGLANNGGYLGSFGVGEMESALEEAAFNLPVGTISDPIRLRIGYAVVKVESRIQQPLASEYDYADNKEKLYRSVHDRKVTSLIRDAVDRIGRD
ncbi:MAG: peptidylprolyl isomerase, partial [Ignavibacteriae bacterium]|nr:peptidylprolyl isomerase [Ignavibacteriota bacterium]